MERQPQQQQEWGQEGESEHTGKEKFAAHVQTGKWSKNGMKQTEMRAKVRANESEQVGSVHVEIGALFVFAFNLFLSFSAQ